MVSEQKIINYKGKIGCVSVSTGLVLVRRNGEECISGNSLNWLKTDFFDSWKKGVPDYKVVQFRSIDSPYFPKEEFERAKATMDVRTFRRRYCGLLEKMEGLVYEDFMTTLHTFTRNRLDDMMQRRTFKEAIAGVDWGFNHAATISVIGIDYDNNFYLIDEYYERGKTTAEIIEKMKWFKDKYNVRFWYPDPAEPDRLEEMKRAGLFPRDVNKGKGSVALGIDKVRELIKQGRFKICEECKYTLEEMSLYHYPEVGDDEEPVKEDDDMLDGIRYAIATYQPSTNANIFSNQPQFAGDSNKLKFR